MVIANSWEALRYEGFEWQGKVVEMIAEDLIESCEQKQLLNQNEWV